MRRYWAISQCAAGVSGVLGSNREFLGFHAESLAAPTASFQVVSRELHDYSFLVVHKRNKTGAMLVGFVNDLASRFKKNLCDFLDVAIPADDDEKLRFRTQNSQQGLGRSADALVLT